MVVIDSGDADSLKCGYVSIFLYAVLSTTACSVIKISLYDKELLNIFIKYNNDYLIIHFSFHLYSQNLSSKII